MLKCECYPEPPQLVNVDDIFSKLFLFCAQCESFARDEGAGLGPDLTTKHLTLNARRSFEELAREFDALGLEFYSDLNKVAEERERAYQAFQAFLEIKLPLGLVPDWRGWTANLPMSLWPDGLALWFVVSEVLMMRASLEPGGLS
jgi:hypothetical protein